MLQAPATGKYALSLIDALHERGSGSLASDARRLVFVLLPLQRATVKIVAQSMGLNVRTLHRRLAETGDEFSAMVNEARRELALRHLQGRVAGLGAIAAQLGYASHSGFTRWFGAQFGVPPQSWRG